MQIVTAMLACKNLIGLLHCIGGVPLQIFCVNARLSVVHAGSRCARRGTARQSGFGHAAEATSQAGF